MANSSEVSDPTRLNDEIVQTDFDRSSSDLGTKGDVYEVILNPGDVLIVPANWWHYVENLELSLTVNTWVPLEKHDAIARLEECFVRTQIEKITESDERADVDALRKYIFNPNEVRGSIHPI